MLVKKYSIIIILALSIFSCTKENIQPNSTRSCENHEEMLKRSVAQPIEEPVILEKNNFVDNTKVISVANQEESDITDPNNDDDRNKKKKN